MLSNQNVAQRILLVEDEAHLAFMLQFNLQREGFEVTLADDGAKAIDYYRERGPFDVVILDVMLPEVSGFDVAEQIRSDDAQTGILMVTAMASDHDRIKGLGLGVDDYITKPFHLEELMMKVKRTAVRSHLFKGPTASDQGQGRVISYGLFTLDADTLTLSGPQGDHTLTALEADILKAFIENIGKVLSRDYLLDKVWKVKGQIETRTVDNFVVRLRRYLEADPANPIHLVSIRGRGYRLMPGSDGQHSQ